MSEKINPTRRQLDELDALLQRMLALPLSQIEQDAASASVGVATLPPPPPPPAPPPPLASTSAPATAASAPGTKTVVPSFVIQRQPEPMTTHRPGVATHDLAGLTAGLIPPAPVPAQVATPASTSTPSPSPTLPHTGYTPSTINPNDHAPLPPGMPGLSSTYPPSIHAMPTAVTASAAAATLAPTAPTPSAVGPGPELGPDESGILQAALRAGTATQPSAPPTAPTKSTVPAKSTAPATPAAVNALPTSATNHEPEHVPVLLWPFVAANAVFDFTVSMFGPPGRWLAGTGGKNLLGWTGVMLTLGAIAWGVVDYLGLID